MGFTEDDSMVRVDFFDVRERGMKWKYTEGVKWLTYQSTHDRNGEPQPDGLLIHDAFEEALEEHLTKPDGTKRMVGMMAVCLEPVHEHAHPIAMLVRR
jgi:hypothetical protein